MFRVLLHPHRLPRTGPMGGAQVMLPAEWNWWRLRVLPHLNTEQFYSVQYDHPTDIHEASLLLSGPDGELIDPPSFHLFVNLPEFQGIDMGAGPTRTLMTRGWSGAFDVVHNDCPGEQWNLLPGNTCAPGDYGIEEVMERRHVQYGRERQWDDSTRREFGADMPLLRWPPFLDLNPPQTRRIGIPEPHAAYTARSHWPRPTPPPAQDFDGLLSGPAYGMVVGETAPARPLSPLVLPESEVIDEIDRLVNEQVRSGPRDDYQVNRYPKCKVCGHDWHGLDCVIDGCDCLNTDWLSGR